MPDWKNVMLQLPEWMPDQGLWGNEDPQSTDGTGLDIAQNALYMWDNWKEIRGRAVLATHVASPTYAPLTCFCDFYGTVYLSTSESRLLGWNETAASYGSSATFADYSKGGAAYPGIVPYSAGDPRWTVPGWSFTIFGQNVIAACSGGNFVGPKMQYRPMNSGSSFADLVASADEPRWAYVGTTKAFLIGANLLPGGAGFYSAQNAQEFGWSAINDPTTWTPDTTGTTQCGFSFVADEDGLTIQGLTCFPEFFLLFKANGVYRVNYTGGALVWDVQILADGAFGLGRGSWSASIVRTGRDVYYWSAAGPAVVIGGEYVQRVGEGKWYRYLSDQIRQTCGDQSSYQVRGCYIPDYHQIAWLIGNISFGGSPFAVSQIVVYDIASYRLTSYQKGSDPGHASIVAPGVVAESICTQKVGVSDSAFDRVRMFEIDEAATTTSFTGFTAGTSSLAIKLQTKLWHPVPDGLVALQKVRLGWKLQTTKHNLSLPATYPAATIVIDYSNDPQFLELTSVTLTYPNLDVNGFWDGPFPLVGGYFRFTVNIPSMSNGQTLRQCSYLELLYIEEYSNA